MSCAHSQGPLVVEGETVMDAMRYVMMLEDASRIARRVELQRLRAAKSHSFCTSAAIV